MVERAFFARARALEGERKADPVPYQERRPLLTRGVHPRQSWQYCSLAHTSALIEASRCPLWGRGPRWGPLLSKGTPCLPGVEVSSCILPLRRAVPPVVRRGARVVEGFRGRSRIHLAKAVPAIAHRGQPFHPGSPLRERRRNIRARLVEQPTCACHRFAPHGCEPRGCRAAALARAPARMPVH